MSETRAIKVESCEKCFKGKIYCVYRKELFRGSIHPNCPLPAWPSVTRKWVADQVWSLWNFDGAYKKSERKFHDEKNAGLIAAVVEVLRRAGAGVPDD